MKKLLFCFFFLAVAIQINAQTAKGITDFALDQTEKLTQIYNLTPEQVKQMTVIQQRKIKNFADIQSLKETDPEKYAAKVKSIQYGTDGSLRKMLTRDQLKIYQDQQIAKRKIKADKIAALKEAGASQEEIKKAMAEEDYK